MIMHFDTHNTGASAEKYKKIAFIIGKRDGNNRCSIANRKAPSLKVSKSIDSSSGTPPSGKIQMLNPD
jgi:hypothetical protein